MLQSSLRKSIRRQNLRAPESLESRVLLHAESILINFQSDDVVNANQNPELTNYLADSGDRYGNRGNGQTYGWLDGNLNPDDQSQTRNRNNGASPDERYDTLNHFIKGDIHSWQIALENGRYDVHIVAGDPSHTDQVNDFLLISGDQQVEIDDPDGQDNFDEYTIREFVVSDGTLRLTPNSDLSQNQKIAFIEITHLEDAAPELAVIENRPAFNVTPFSAELAGEVTDDGNSPPNVRIYWGTTDEGVAIAAWDQSINMGVQTGAYSSLLTDLQPETTYYYRSLAANLAGFSWASPTFQVTTPPIQPASVANIVARDIGAFSAVIGGTVTDSGNETPIVSLFWGDNDGGDNAGDWDQQIDLGLQAGNFSSALSNLTHNTNYYYRARVTNAGGETWSDETASFKTLQVVAPTIASQAALDVEAFQVLITGQISDTGNEIPNVRLFWGASDGGTNRLNWDHQIDLGHVSSFLSSTITGLNQDSQYFFRTAATNQAGTTWADETSWFRTLKVTLPELHNEPAIQITSSAAELRGVVTDAGNDAPVVTVYYGTSDQGTNAAAWEHSIEVGEEFGSFTAKATNLQSETTYFYRAIGSNFAGEAWSPETSAFTTAKAPTLLITELMASNATTLTTKIRETPAGSFSDAFAPDWIEIHNPGTETVDLSGLYLTDDPDNLARWQFPNGTTLDANSYLLVMASGEDIIDPQLDDNRYLHTNFKLASTGEFLAITESDGTIIHGYESGFPKQRTDFSYGINSDGKAQYYSGVTPGAANSDGTVNFVADTNFSIDRGFYDEPFELEVTSRTPGSILVYTTDGTLPTKTNGIRVEAASDLAIPAAKLNVSTTTSVRAFAFKDGFEPTNVDTHSYIFLNDVLKQATNPNTGQQVIPNGFPTSWGNGARGDYQVDPDIVNHENESDRLVPDDLKSVATIAIVMDNEDLFGDNQIYLTGSGSPRAASVELISGDGSEEFQINGSIQVQGGSSTNRWKDYKLSLRLKFQDPYGPSKLDHALYEDSPIDSYDNIILDGVLNHSWLHSGQQNQPQYIQDQYVADLHNEMGGHSPYGRFMHVYLNGLYWGMYYVHDRPDHAWAAKLFGGNKDEYHAVKHNGSTVINDGNGERARTSYSRMVSAATAVQRDPDDLEKWQTLQERLDVDNFITYSLANWYTGNHDWPHKNWYATAHHDGPWRFHSWDAEHVTDSNNDTGESPDDLHNKLDGNDEYRMRMADLVHKHFFNDGVLTPETASGLWQERMDEIDRAIVGESARWGDNRNARAHTREEWLRYNGEDGLLKNWFPRRTRTVLSQMRSRGIYPDLDAPEFNQHGGSIATGFHVEISNPDNQGTIYYSTDGTDPRMPGGDLNPDVPAYSEPITLDDTATILARIKNGNEWSALLSATFYVNPATAGDVAITEINYHPHASLSQFGETIVDPDLYEFVELKNTTDHPIDLTGVQLVDSVVDGRINGIQFEFGNQILAANEHLVVVKNVDAFQDRYGDQVPIALGLNGEFSEYVGRLNNGGEQLTLLAADGSILQQFRYNDGGNWPGRADGSGSSLEVISVNGDYGDSNNFRSSSEFGGSPGADGLGPADDVVINEVLTHTDLPQVDAIELHNATGADIDVGNWYVSDSANDYFRHRISTETIPAGGYLALDENQLGFGFRGETSDDAWLISADNNGKPVRFMDHVSFNASENGVSLGRWPDGNGRLFPMSAVTLGDANSGPVVSPIVISEVQYHPVDPAAQNQLDAKGLEFVELYNSGNAVLDIGSWRLDNAVDFTFDSPTTLGPDSGLVVVSFDPSDQLLADDFRASYQIGAQVELVGPFKGVLDNAGDRVELERPEDLNQIGLGYILVDRVDYGVVAPWPQSADGGGHSLQRTAADAYGDFASSWQGLPASPGSAQLNSNMADGDLNQDGIISADDIDYLCGGLNSNDPVRDLNDDGVVSHMDVDVLVHDILRTHRGDANLDGIFDSSDLVAIFQIGHYEDGVAGNSGWAEGDWNCDGEFDTGDLVAAFQEGAYRG